MIAAPLEDQLIVAFAGFGRISRPQVDLLAVDPDMGLVACHVAAVSGSFRQHDAAPDFARTHSDCVERPTGTMLSADRISGFL